jgi:hypothetical protein
MKISKLLYALTSDIEKVSLDRTQRFIAKSSNQVDSTKLSPLVFFKKQDIISMGDYVAVSGNFGLRVGLLVKFQKLNEKTEKMEPFKYNSLILNKSKNVQFFLHPCFEISQRFRGILSIVPYKRWYKEEDYKITVNEDCVDSFKSQLLFFDEFSNLIS